MPYHVNKADFDSLVEKAVEGLPEEFKQYFTNITIMVEDYPSKEDKKLAGSKGLLLGLFKGVPYTSKGGFFNIPYPLPDKIILFRKILKASVHQKKSSLNKLQKY